MWVALYITKHDPRHILNHSIQRIIGVPCGTVVRQRVVKCNGFGKTLSTIRNGAFINLNLTYDRSQAARNPRNYFDGPQCILKAVRCDRDLHAGIV